MSVTARIPLRNRKGETIAYALVDPDAAERLNRWRWHLNNYGYAVHSMRRNGRYQKVFMHRVILALEHRDGRHTDHVNGDRLDNRRSNLRVVSQAENNQNLSSRGGSSAYRGVGYHKQHQKWRAAVRFEGRYYFLGYFDDELEAARVVSDWRRAHMPFSEEKAA